MKPTKKRTLIRAIALIAILCGVIGFPNPTGRASSNASIAPTFMGVTVRNNSSRTIAHLYISQLNPEAWSADLISQGLTTGQSYTITDVSCTANEIKVIAEDPQGCFSYGIVSCAEAAASWTVTNDTPIDCGN